MFRGTDNIMWKISTFRLNVGNIPHNIVSPTSHCYESKYYYDNTWTSANINQCFPTFPSVSIVNIHLLEGIILPYNKERLEKSKLIGGINFKVKL